AADSDPGRDPESEVSSAEVVAATPCQSGLILVQPVLAANTTMQTCPRIGRSILPIVGWMIARFDREG
ncbi:MAG: hypothetical protein AB1Z98_22805, partial [Nannocystaceae bacterium]